MDNLTKISPNSAKERAELYPLAKFLGTVHQIPLEPSDEATILVTRSRNLDMIGKEYKVTVDQEGGILDAWAGGYIVSGPICDHGSKEFHNRTVAFPYEEGWAWGDFSHKSEDGYVVRVKGGVGVSAPVTPDGKVLTFKATVPAVYPIPTPHYYALPSLVDTEDDLRKKFLAVKLRNRERETQDALMRAMMDSHPDGLDPEDFPEFKHSNVWHMTGEATLITQTGLAEGEVPEDIWKSSIDETAHPVTAVRHRIKLPAHKFYGVWPEQAIDKYRDMIPALAKRAGSPSSAIMSHFEDDPIYGGIV